MATRNDERLVGHAVDGIEEYDNPLPSWWVWIFWATIVFSAGYWIYYQHGPGPSVVAEYEAETRQAAEQAAARAPKTAAVTDEAILALRRDAGAMAKAKETFAAKCVVCHGALAQGIIGPNLTDEYWIHGATPVEMVKTINDGVPAKGMIAWKDQLPPEEIRALAAYIDTLRGSNPPNPKPPEGRKVGAATAASGR